MRVASRVAAAVCAAALSGVCAARAADLTFGAEKFLFFSGLDLWRHGAFSYGGGLWAPEGIDQDGFVFKLAGGAGRYRYRSGALNADITGDALSFSTLPGWRFRRGAFIVTGFAGFEMQRHELTPDDVTSRLRGISAGIRGAIEGWYEPAPGSMIAADLSATSIGPSYSGRLAFGWLLFDRFYAGPEGTAFSFDGNYRQYRVGVHVTALQAGAFEWSGGLGWSRDSDDRKGLYARLGMLMRSNLFW
ncbi:MAG TPA: cellulose biosynthesis protein BcsS [Pseudorhodoplanes sp.]|nr:cellulose biosynthesis protein BcsS [Pseudorhodoplanes sp.]